MKIVLTDAQTVIDDLVNADPLRALGEVTEHGLLAYEEVAEQIADADVVVCNKTLMDAHTLRYAKKLRYIGLFATGYNNIDIDYCRAHGIAVCNAGSYSTNAVAQHTFALILEAYNRTAQYDRYVHDGLWKRSPTFSPFVYPLNELADKTLGIVGLLPRSQAPFKCRSSAATAAPRPWKAWRRFRLRSCCAAAISSACTVRSTQNRGICLTKPPLPV